jgi:hypothetical protein
VWENTEFLNVRKTVRTLRGMCEGKFLIRLLSLSPSTMTLCSVQNVIYDYNGQSLDGIVTPDFVGKSLDVLAETLQVVLG